MRVFYHTAHPKVNGFVHFAQNQNKYAKKTDGLAIRFGAIIKNLKTERKILSAYDH